MVARVSAPTMSRAGAGLYGAPARLVSMPHVTPPSLVTTADRITSSPVVKLATTGSPAACAYFNGRTSVSVCGPPPEEDRILATSNVDEPGVPMNRVPLKSARIGITSDVAPTAVALVSVVEPA